MTRGWARHVFLFAVVATVVLLALLAGAAYASRLLALPGAVAIAVTTAGAVTAFRQLYTPRQVTMPPDLPSDPGLRPFRRLARVRERVEWGVQSPERFRTALLPMLDELATDRLRRSRGVDRHHDPDAARRLLGDELEALLAGRSDGQVPDLRQLDDFVRRIEVL